MNVLVLTAHGDDMDFFAGGTIAKLCLLGHRVHLVLATDNTKGTFELTRDEMFAVRVSEPEAWDGTRARVTRDSWGVGIATGAYGLSFGALAIAGGFCAFAALTVGLDVQSEGALGTANEVI